MNFILLKVARLFLNVEAVNMIIKWKDVIVKLKIVKWIVRLKEGLQELYVIVCNVSRGVMRLVA